MFDADLKFIDEITCLTAEKRSQSLGYFQHAKEPVRLEIMATQTRLMRNLREKFYDKSKQSEFAYALLILAIEKVREPERKLHKKSGAPLTEQMVQSIRNTRIERLKIRKPRVSNVREDIERLFFVITDLRDKNLSWMKVAQYLEEHHNVKVSHNYCKKSFELIQKRRELLKDTGTTK